MNKPSITGGNWVLTLVNTDSDGEELWELVPNGNRWTMYLHIEESGRLYQNLLSPKRRKGRSSGDVDQRVVVEAISALARRIHMKKNIIVVIGIPADKSFKKMFTTYRKAGFNENGQVARMKGRPNLVFFAYQPGEESAR